MAAFIDFIYILYALCFLNNCVSYIAYDRIYSCHDILDLYLNKFHDRSKIFKKYWKLD